MKHKFKVGDRVKIKSWKEMEKEFGVDSHGDIKAQYYFTKNMQKFCNTYATIKKIDDKGVCLLEDFSKKGLCYGDYFFTIDMLKPVKEKKKDLASEDLEDCVEYGLNGCKCIVADDVKWTLDEQIKWHEEKLAELKAQKEKEKWKFTEDEKVILRNLSEEYKYIARDMNGELYILMKNPRKHDIDWVCNYINNFRGIPIFNHIFQCIQWSDTEPCEFRKYI